MYANKRVKLNPLAVAVLSVCASAYAAADMALEEVIVTAQKKAESAQDVGLSIAVISSEALNRYGLTNVEDLDNLASGLFISSTGGGESTILRMRGLGAPRFIQSQPQFVGVFVDEFTQNRPGIALNDLVDVASVEVLRGPQSTLYGKNVPAGAISISTNRADYDEFSWGGSLTLAERSQYQGNIMLNVPVIEDVLALRFSAYYNDNDGQTNVQPADQSWGASERKGGRLQLGFAPTENFEARLAFEHRELASEAFEEIARVDYVWNSWFGGLTGQLGGYSPATDLSGLNNPGAMFPGLPAVVVEAIDPFDGFASRDVASTTDVETDQATLHLNYAFNDTWALTYVGGYQEYATEGYIDADATNVNWSALSPITLDTEYTSHELRLEMESDRSSAMLGVFWDKETHDSDLLVELALLPTPSVGNSTDQEWTTRSLFANYSYEFSDKLSLIVGARHAYTEIELTENTVNRQSETDFDYWSGNARVQYHWTDEVMTYVSLARGVQYGGFNASVLTNPALQDAGAQLVFDPSASTNIEAGWKTRLLDQRLELNGAIFRQQYDDYQSSVTINSLNTFITNVGGLIVQGVELDGVFLLTDNLMLDASISYTDSEIEDFTNAPCSGLQRLTVFHGASGAPASCANGSQDLSGKRLNEAPLWSGTLGASYTQAMPSLGAELMLRGDMAFRDDFISELYLDERQNQAAYAIFNASAGLRWDSGITLSVWAKNLGDKNYCNYKPVANVDPLTPFSGVRCSVGSERQVGLTLSYSQ